MEARITGLLVAILVTIVLAVTFVTVHPHGIQQELLPTVTFYWSAMEANVTQGGSVNINCTTFNTSANQSINEGFGIQLVSINNVNYWENATLWSKIFNQTFTPHTLLVEPLENGTTTLTITIAPDAPLGTYNFALQGSQKNFVLNVEPKLL